jgi:hypothetical protein
MLCSTGAHGNVATWALVQHLKGPTGDFSVPVRKQSRLTDTAKVGRKDRYPSDYGVRDAEEANTRKAKNRSWSPGDKGQGREGHSKGYGGSGGRGTGPSGPEEDER